MFITGFMNMSLLFEFGLVNVEWHKCLVMLISILSLTPSFNASLNLILSIDWQSYCVAATEDNVVCY